MEASLSQIARWIGARLDGEASVASRVATSITWDSRQVRPDALYVALPGARVDGHDFVASAIEKGAAGALVMRDPGQQAHQAAQAAGAALLFVEDTTAAFERLAVAWRGQLGALVIGITGSSGKTTTKNLVRDVLSTTFSTVATQANQNNELGVPNTVLSADRSTEMLVVEMGMRGEGQIAALCECVRPQVGLVTNVGDAHVELLGSRNAIARAKAELYQALPDGSGVAVVNADDPMGPVMVNAARLPRRGVRIVSFDGSGKASAAFVGGNGAGACAASEGTGVPDVLWASDVSLGCDGRPSFTLNFPNRSLRCTLELRGLHNVANALAAAAVGHVAGVAPEDVVAALEASLPEGGRQQVLRTKAGVTVFDDAYNANPDSMRASLEAFVSMEASGRRFAVLGDMGELGCAARDHHWQLGAFAAGMPFDGLVCVGRLSREIARGAVRSGFDEDKIVTLDDAQAALAWLEPRLEPGDAVLVKASHAMGFDRIIRGLTE